MPITAAELPLGVIKPLFRIFALGEGETFPTVDFLESLKQSDLKSYDRLMATLKSASERGPPTNDKTKCRQIRGIKQKIFELKTNDGNRVLWFYDAGRIMLCTNAFEKPGEKELKQKIGTAQTWHDKYVLAKTTNKIIFE